MFDSKNLNDYPLISVIIPSYNHALYIRDCIQSVLNQSYKNIEIIVVDDGSVDNTLDILQDFKNQIVLHIQKNQGVSSALNNGVKLANGHYLSILASDDMFHPKKIEEQFYLLQMDKQSDLCFCKALYFDDDINNVIDTFPNKFYKGFVTEKIFIKQLVPAGSILFTKSLYNLIGGFNENLKEEDWDFIIKASAFTKFSFLEKPYFFYRHHPLQTMVHTSRLILLKRKFDVLNANKKFETED